jgi:hypothetical protein
MFFKDTINSWKLNADGTVTGLTQDPNGFWHLAPGTQLGIYQALSTLEEIRSAASKLRWSIQAIRKPAPETDQSRVARVASAQRTGPEFPPRPR